MQCVDCCQHRTEVGWLTGRVRVETYRSEGRRPPRLIAVSEQENLVTFTGKSLLLHLWLAQATTPGVAIAWGENATTQTVDDAALYSEILRTPLASVSTVSRVGNAAVLTVRARLGKTQGNGTTFREVGLVTSTLAGQGLLLARAAIADAVKTDQKFLLLQWQFTLT